MAAATRRLPGGTQRHRRLLGYDHSTVSSGCRVSGKQQCFSGVGTQDLVTWQTTGAGRRCAGDSGGRAVACSACTSHGTDAGLCSRSAYRLQGHVCCDRCQASASAATPRRAHHPLVPAAMAAVAQHAAAVRPWRRSGGLDGAVRGTCRRRLCVGTTAAGVALWRRVQARGQGCGRCWEA